MEELPRSEIPPIDLVCVILYPFLETVGRLGAMPRLSSGGEGIPPALDDALENIDIGGPTMLRAAAKNFPAVLVLVDPADYDETLDRLRTGDADPLSLPLEFRRRQA